MTETQILTHQMGILLSESFGHRQILSSLNVPVSHVLTVLIEL